jgi:hypothetical protein
MGTTATRTDRRQRNEGQLVHPPRAVDRVNFPPELGNRFTIFVYTQETFSRSGPIQGLVEAIAHLPEFQRLAEAHGAIPCYLLNYTIAMNGLAQDILGPISESGRGVIGAQLQPWATPPFSEELTVLNSYPGNLPAALEHTKLASLTDAITNYFGQRPQIFRAGRYGVGTQTADLLCNLGYRMDVSVRPRFDYREDGGPDFRRHDARPFWAGRDRGLLALPLSACHIGWARKAGAVLYTHARRFPRIEGLLARSHALARVALTPEDMPIADAKEAVRVLLGEGVNILNFAMHSPSLSPGHTPYVRTSAELNEFYRWWEEMLTMLAGLNVRPVAADAIIAAAWSQR